MSDCARRPGELPGYEVAVALMQQMGVREGVPVNDQARDFARELMTAWGVGNAACNDGVLLLLSKEPREVYIYAGPGAAPRLMPKRILAIIANMRPALRAGNFDAALQRAAVDIGLVLNNGHIGGDDDDPAWRELLQAGFWVSLFGGIVGLSWWKGRKQRQQVRAVQALMDKLKREQAIAAATHAYPALSCPVCFEDFEDAPAAQPPPSAPPLPLSGFPDPATGFRDPAGRSSGAAEASGGGGREGDCDEGKSTMMSDAELCSPLLPPLGSRHSGRGSVVAARKRLVLPCGHAFCEDCISQWVKAHETCPICREPLVARQAPSVVERWAPGLHEQELMFRLIRIQRGYPGIVDNAMVRHWSEDARAGRPIEWSSARWQAERQRQLSDPQLRADRAGAGAHGAGGSSFGGGGGGGGGGAGGGW
ncbi:hypothetical protein WJX81_003096 [Elliptochloris bilobata]|uniref:RING-type domain-containing protein n=1 Tax=Elliptochloris bilobata TaxID=381761 RepID=A0AAW1S0V5_9CHLO